MLNLFTKQQYTNKDQYIFFYSLNNELILPKGNYVEEKSYESAPKKQGTIYQIDVTKFPQVTRYDIILSSNTYFCD